MRVTLYKPMPYQLAVHNGLEAHWREGIHIVKAVRQSGKSMMAINILMKASLEHQGEVSIMISPTLKQARKVFKDILKACKGTGLVVGSNGSDLEITFRTGSVVQFLSGEQDEESLRGYTVSKHGILIIDEAAYISDNVFYTVIHYVNATHAPILCISTPKFRNGFFYDYYIEGEKGTKNVYAYDFTDYDNPFLTAERLEMFRQKMPINLFRADYLGQWMENTSELFGDFATLMDSSYPVEGQMVAGVDWGVGREAKSGNSDYTAVSIMNGKRQQVKMYHWNDLSATDTIKRIVEAFLDWNVTKAVVETNSIGAVYLDLLRQEIRRKGAKCSIVGFNTNNASKRQIIEGLVVDIQNRAIRLIDDNELKIQLSAYQMERTPSGLITYNAASGYHDDCVIATALSNHGTKTANLSWL